MFVINSRVLRHQWDKTVTAADLSRVPMAHSAFTSRARVSVPTFCCLGGLVSSPALIAGRFRVPSAVCVFGHIAAASIRTRHSSAQAMESARCSQCGSADLNETAVLFKLPAIKLNSHSDVKSTWGYPARPKARDGRTRACGRRTP